MPPYLAGRKSEEAEFTRLLDQDIILENLILNWLAWRGENRSLRQLQAPRHPKGWIWVGADLSEAVSVSETNLATRIITDLSVVTSALTLNLGEKSSAGFTSEI